MITAIILYDNINENNNYESLMELKLNGSNKYNFIINGDNDKSLIFTNIISAFGSYCNEFSLYWFYRLLYSQIFLSTTKPKYIFIFIHNLGNLSVCNGYNNNILLYKYFIKYIEIYYKNKIKIFIYFDDKLYSASYSRNFLSNKIYKFIYNDNKYNNLSINGNIIISFFDADDIPHPQKYEILDYIYSNININGTILHAYRTRYCRKISINILNDYNQFIYNILNINDNDNNNIIYNKINKFHNKMLIKWNQTIYSIFSNIKLNINYYNNNIRLHKVNFDDDDDDDNLNLPILERFAIIGINETYKSIDWTGCCANGWPITTLSALIKNPYKTYLSTGEDHQFQHDTINSNFKVYRLPTPFILGIYCLGDLKFKAHQTEN